MHLRRRRNKPSVVRLLRIGFFVTPLFLLIALCNSPMTIYSPCFLNVGARGVVYGNSFIGLGSPFVREKSLGSRTITGYSSTVDQCDSTPFITASGQRVRTGIVASNEFPFGTILKIDGLPFDGEVQDRMNRRYKNGEIDIWFPTRAEALGWGKQVREIIQLN
jgi:3D (Asp-Asp-Asp) domain-containing protein